MTSTSISTTTPICPSPCPRPTDRPVGPLWRPTASYASRFPTARCRPRAAAFDHEQRRERLQPHRVPGRAGTVGSGDAQYTLDIPSGGARRRHRIVPIDHNVHPHDPAGCGGLHDCGFPYREGTGSPAEPEQVVNLQQAYIRNLATGLPKDTDDNTADFTTVDTLNGTLTGNGQRVGMPGPRGTTASPIRRAQILVSDIPPLHRRCATTEAPTGTFPAAGVNPASGVLSFPRRFTNNTGSGRQPAARANREKRTCSRNTRQIGTLRPIDATGTVTRRSGTVVVSGLRPMLLELPVAVQRRRDQQHPDARRERPSGSPGQRCVSQCAPEGGRCPEGRRTPSSCPLSSKHYREHDENRQSLIDSPRILSPESFVLSSGVISASRMPGGLGMHDSGRRTRDSGLWTSD